MIEAESQHLVTVSWQPPTGTRESHFDTHADHLSAMMQEKKMTRGPCDRGGAFRTYEDYWSERACLGIETLRH